jgi:hypothetical protein
VNQIGAESSDPTYLRWLRIAGLASGTLLGLALGVGAFLYGGIPHGYDNYGIVSVPGRQVLDLPEGRVMLDHADDVEGCWDNVSHIENASIQPAPSWLTVKVASVNDGTALPVTPIPRWLYSNITNCRGHEPFGRIKIPKAGKYLVETSDAKHSSPGRVLELKTQPTKASAKGTGIAFGPRPWAPFGSPLLAGTAVAMIAIALIVLPIERMWARARF